MVLTYLQFTYIGIYLATCARFIQIYLGNRRCNRYTVWYISNIWDHWSMVACRWARYCSCISRHGHEPLWFQWRLNQQLVTESSMYGPQSSPTLGQEGWLAEQLACGHSWGRQRARMQHFNFFFVIAAVVVVRSCFCVTKCTRPVIFWWDIITMLLA